ncbi:1,4-alpha-glucan branching protein GlgB [Endozoicomonas acroporae]|uniref:1,4-alpha-glucan branching protein GlgB n=1 Tax=Endozoicomonas acroporae TaxID=1701104 RepID=UPI001F510E43|nr:1,4-alpha-glucan branching protein GlgB [Endozoicomonas acroporae]
MPEKKLMGAELIPVTQSLNQVMNASPFSILGIHPAPSGSGLTIRAWHPDAECIEVVLESTGKSLGRMNRLANGLFELEFPRRKKTFYYLLNITLKDGSEELRFDPYQFGEYTLCQQDIDPLHLYRHLGALKVEHAITRQRRVSGVLFKVYAPHARSVSVIGDFNRWDGRCHPMASADDGIWRLFVPGVSEGALYKYELHDQNGQLLPEKSDPFGHKVEQWPGLASIVQTESTFTWSDKQWMNKRQLNHNKAMSVYEVHLGSWKKLNDDGFINYRELADELIPYIRKTGFTHIELLPISEHPLYESWGYQPVGLFAPTSRYGTPDDFRYLVDQCHQHHIGVILDWVPAHFPQDEHGLFRFDGTAIYEYEDPQRGWHPDWKSCIYNYGSPWVQDFLISNALYWLDEFHIDGLRVDAVASMLYLDYSRKQGEWTPNHLGGNEHLEAVAFLQRLNHEVHRLHPHCMMIAEESTSWPCVSRPGHPQSLGFDYKWNMGWMHDTLAYMKRDPIHRQHHHHEMTFSMVYAYNENFVLSLSHDEVVHGKGTILTRMPGDDWQRFANLRAYYGFMFGHPGKKLMFMGSEFGVTNEWNPAESLNWNLLEQGPYHQGLLAMVSELNRIYQHYPALHELDFDRDGFRWLILEDHGQSVFAFYRKDSTGKTMVIISNMTPYVRHDYRIGVPVNGLWQEIFNSDDQRFGGSHIVNGTVSTRPGEWHNHPQNISLTLPPLATIMLTVDRE